MSTDFNKLYNKAREKLSNYLGRIGQDKSLPDIKIRKIKDKLISEVKEDSKKHSDKYGIRSATLYRLEQHYTDMYFYQWGNGEVNIFHESEKRMKKISFTYPGITKLNWHNIIIANFAHELIHAHLHINCGVSAIAEVKSMLVHEYLACAIGRVLLNDKNISEMKRDAGTVDIPKDWFNVDVFMNNGARRFAWPAYLHYIKNGQAKIFAEILERKENWRPY